MPSVKLSPLFNDAQLNDNGTPLSGGKVYWYLAGTSTPATTYADAAGGTPNANPVILDVRGEPTQPIWLVAGQAYKATLTDSLDNVIRQIDNISGVNDTAVPVISEWVLHGGAATFINTTQFSIVGDQRATFTKNRRIRANCSGTDLYGTISINPVFATGATAVTLVLDSGVLDSSLNSVYYGFTNPEHPSILITEFDTNTLVTQTYTAFTTAGSSGTFTLTPTTPIVSYVAGQRFRVKFHANGNGTDTINISELGAKSVKQFDINNAKSAPQIFINQLADVEYDGTDFVILNPIRNTAGTIIQFAGNTPPIGYMECPTVATNVSRTTYAALFAAIGTLWGAGDGSTTFGIPYLEADHTWLQAGGSAVGSFTSGEVISHNHTFQSQLLLAGVTGGAAYFAQFTGASNTSSTGGAANKAAGRRLKYCVKY